MDNRIPPSIQMLQVIVSQLEIHSDVLSPGTPKYIAFSEVINVDGDFNTNDMFLQNPEFISLVQTLFLGALSMYGGVFVPSVKQFSCHDNRVRIVWESGITDTFTFGVFDEDFLKFSRSFQVRLGNKRQVSSTISISILGGIYQYFRSYSEILKVLDNRLQKLMAGPQSIISNFQKGIDRDLLFVFISCLPSDQMNSLFIYIQQFFPGDLEVKTPSGKMVKATSFFESNSTDVRYLIEKTKVYMDLYFKNNQPIIQHITQSKTIEYLQKVVSNTQNYNQTMDNLKSLKATHVDLRQQLYGVLASYLNRVLT